ncbi:MAG TPA: hypothetical protein VFI65_30935 [Streptosporangiaceae bacterium]|nr:hypothetical protein [Streptosporangiaceae bacterium]
MGFNEIMQIWRRRAGLTAGLVLLALASFVAALLLFPASYQSQASEVLLASRAASKVTGGNPYLGFTPSLSLTADVVSRALMSPATARQLALDDFPDSYTVVQPTYTTSTTGSVLLITVTGTDPADVQRTMQGVIFETKVELRQMQENVPPRNQITVSTLASSPRAVLAMSATIRPIAMTLIFGLIIAFGLPVVIDGVARRRKVKHAVGKRVGVQGRVRQLADSLSRSGVR